MTKTIPELWTERQRCHAENQWLNSQEGTAFEAVPDWARHARSKIAGCESMIDNPRYSEADQIDAARKSNALDTEQYRRAIVPYEDWERRSSLIFGELCAVERKICDTPAASIDDVLIKVRIAGYWFDLEHGTGRLVEDDGVDEMLPEERMTLMAYRDIMRLCNDPPDIRHFYENARRESRENALPVMAAAAE